MCNLYRMTKGTAEVARLFAVEPDLGEANHLYLLDVLDRLGYQGYVGLEYKPKTTTGAGLGWAKKYGVDDVEIGLDRETGVTQDAVQKAQQIGLHLSA